MPVVRFTSNLKRFYPNLSELHTDARSIKQLIVEIDKKFPGLKNYITDDQNQLRHHVNIFVNDTMILDRIELKDEIKNSDDIFIMQALSGG